MIELSTNGVIEAKQIADMGPEELEAFIESELADKISTTIALHLEDLAFIDIKPQKDGSFEYTADFVLCGADAIIEGVKAQAVRMAHYGLTSEQIEEILALTTNG